MLITKRMLLILTLGGALVGAGIGSLITHSAASSTAANNGYDKTQTANSAEKTPEQIAAEQSSHFSTSQEQTAYRQGFAEGYSTCSTATLNTQTRTSADPATYRAPVRRSSRSGRVYYDYGNQPKGRTFWQKHRDKLTLAIGTGAGAGIGGLIGGGKGAGIGSLVGLGSSALYTYKLRNRSQR